MPFHGHFKYSTPLCCISRMKQGFEYNKLICKISSKEDFLTKCQNIKYIVFISYLCEVNQISIFLIYLNKIEKQSDKKTSRLSGTSSGHYYIHKALER